MKSYGKIKEFYQKTIKFLISDIWHLDISELTKVRSRLIKYLKVLIITIRGFTKDKVALQAISLSFFSAMSVVPFIAIMFTITDGFGAAAKLERLLYSYFSNSEEIISYILGFATNVIETSRNGLFGLISITFLLSTIIVLLFNVEMAFNQIWKIDSGRSFKKRALYYLGLLISSPFIIFVFLSLGLLYSKALKNIGLEIDRVIPITSIISWLIAYLFIVGVFTLMYKYIPNTKVKLSAAFGSALVLAFAFLVVQFFYLETQLMVTGLNAVYGVFAAIPLFMIWMNISWTLILFGVELSHAYQNVENYRQI